MSGDSLHASKLASSLSRFSQTKAVNLSKPKNVTKEINNLNSPKNSKFHHYRFELEHDVQRLKAQLQKETALGALLLKASDQSDKIELSYASSLPRSVQEFLSNISLMEATVSKLEQEIMTLHFLLIQERNEKKLTEYSLTDASPIMDDLPDEPGEQEPGDPHPAEIEVAPASMPIFPQAGIKRDKTKRFKEQVGKFVEITLEQERMEPAAGQDTTEDTRVMALSVFTISK